MSIQDYAGLVEGVQRWCARSDTTFTNRIPDFVALAEDRIYNGSDLEARGPLYSAPLRVNVLEATGTITFTDGVASLPDRFLGFRKLYRSGDQTGLVYLPPERFEVRNAYSAGASPSHFTIEGSSIRVLPSYDGDMSATFWQSVPPLTAEANTNALLTAHPMVYLSATLFEAWTFVQEAELALGHVTRLRSMIDGLNKTATGARTSGGTRRVQPRNAIP
jgi:hypothetical protein